MSDTDTHLGLLRAAQQVALQLKKLDRADARALVVRLHDLLGDPATAPTTLGPVVDQGRAILTEAAREVELERAEREAALGRMADRVLAKKRAEIAVKEQAIRETAGHFAAAFVGAMRLGAFTRDEGEPTPVGNGLEAKIERIVREEIVAFEPRLDELIGRKVGELVSAMAEKQIRDVLSSPVIPEE